MASLTSACLRPRFALLKPLQAAAPSSHLTMIKNYYSSDCSSGIMGEKARSTAEEFKRQAKEKAESVSEGAKVEAWEGSKESTVSSSNSSDKDKLKETVEKGNYDKINGKE